MNSGKIIVGVLASLAAGAAIGILYNTDKGKATRKKISNKKNEYSNDLEEKFHSLVTAVTGKYDEISNQVKSIAKSGVEKTDQLMKEVTSNSVK
jgi:gas vesicle protein